MSGDVFIIGAGFSKAISDEMPILAELPKYLRERDKEAPWEKLLRYVNDDVEHLMTLLAQPQPWESEATNLERRAMFLRFSERLAAVMQDRQNIAITRQENVPDWLDNLVEAWVARHSTVITFNYDTLVEKVYLTRGRDDNKRTSHDLYMTPFTDLRGRDGGMRFGGGQDVAAFRLLKLHGSVNWYYSGVPNSAGEVLYFLEPSFGWWVDIHSHVAWDTAPDKVALVVPPTADKSTFLGHESIRTQWTQAAFELFNADDVYFLGYSMPETDLMVRFMIQNTLLDADTRCFVVNKAVTRDGESRVSEVRSAYNSLGLKAQMNYDYVGAEDVVPRFVDNYAKGLIN